MAEPKKYKPEDLIRDKTFHGWVHKTDAKDIAFWEKYLLENPGIKEELEAAADMVRGINFQKKQASREEIADQWLRLKSRLDEKGKVVDIRKGWSYTLYYRIAAILVGVSLCVGIFYQIFNRSASVEIVSRAGEIKILTLPDGSEVIMQGNSELQYEEEWEKGEGREIWLEGQAYFSVKHMPGNESFNVHTGELTAEVLGTEFDVYARRNKTRVVLSSGKLRLENNTGGNQLIIQPGDLAELSAGERDFLVKKVDPGYYKAWTTQKMVFNDMPLKEISLMIEDIYDVKVQIKNPQLADKKLSGEIEVKSLDDLLRALFISLNVKASKTNNILILE